LAESFVEVTHSFSDLTQQCQSGRRWGNQLRPQ